MRIDIWSDIVCPWCWIGKHRFARGVALLGEEAPPLEIHFHAFQLDPGASPDPVPLREAYAAKFGDDAAGVERRLAQMQQTGRAEGLPFDFGRGQVRVNTLRAHRLMWLASAEGDAAVVAEALFRAHFAEGRDLSAMPTLIAAGAAGGLAPERVQAMLDSDEGLAEVRAELAQAQTLGITAVPSFVVDGRYLVQGAQPPEAFAQMLRQIAAEGPVQGGGGGKV